MSSYKFIAIFIVISVVCGCVAGPQTKYYPQMKYPDGQYNRVFSYQCGDIKISPESFFSDGFVVYYYIVPLFPDFNESRTETHLEVRMSMFSKKIPIFDLALEDVQVRLDKSDHVYNPYKILLLSDIERLNEPWYHKKFHFFFDIDRHYVDTFTLALSDDVTGCDNPVIRYVKKEATHFTTPTNR